jgi:hypothetical protein
MASKDELDRWAGLGGKVLEEAGTKKGTNKAAKTTSFVAPDGRAAVQHWRFTGLRRMKGPYSVLQLRVQALVSPLGRAPRIGWISGSQSSLQCCKQVGRFWVRIYRGPSRLSTCFSLRLLPTHPAPIVHACAVPAKKGKKQEAEQKPEEPAPKKAKKEPQPATEAKPEPEAAKQASKGKRKAKNSEPEEGEGVEDQPATAEDSDVEMADAPAAAKANQRKAAQGKSYKESKAGLKISQHETIEVKEDQTVDSEADALAETGGKASIRRRWEFSGTWVRQLSRLEVCVCVDSLWNQMHAVQVDRLCSCGCSWAASAP